MACPLAVSPKKSHPFSLNPSVNKDMCLDPAWSGCNLGREAPAPLSFLSVKLLALGPQTLLPAQLGVGRPWVRGVSSGLERGLQREVTPLPRPQPCHCCSQQICKNWAKRQPDLPSQPQMNSRLAGGHLLGVCRCDRAPQAGTR